jgi:HlyD family secretion protein
MKKNTLRVTALLSLLLFGCSSEQTQTNPTPASKQTAQISRRNIEKSIEAVGIVTPYQTVDVKSKASGKIMSMPFEAGDYVKFGDLLVMLDPVDEQRNVRSQEAQVAQAAATLKKTEIQLERIRRNFEIQSEEVASRLTQATSDYNTLKSELTRSKSLFEQKLIPKQELEAVENRFHSASSALDLAKTDKKALALSRMDIDSTEQDLILQKARLQQQEISLEISQIKLDETRILAPMSGIILTKDVEPGQIISSGISNVSGGTSLLTLADVSRLVLDTEVDESDVGHISEGLPVELTVEAYPGKEFKGKILQIAPQGEAVQNITIFRVKIELTGDSVKYLMPGMNGTAKIIYENHPNLLCVPAKALVRRGKKFGVLIPGGEEPQFIEVSVGYRDPDFVEIKGDVKDNQTVLLTDNNASEGGGRGAGFPLFGRRRK